MGSILPFIIALAITPIVRKFALSKGITDEVDGDLLKIHKKPVALLGGVAILITMAIGIFVGRISYVVYRKELLGIMAGGGLIFAVGLWDDVKAVKPIVRLLVHVLAGAIILLAGIKVNFISIWWISMLLTLFYIAGAINAFNVTDGMDGLCVGISLVSCIGFFFLGLKSRNALLMVLSVSLFMSLLGFLPYNFHPARIFLGDAGSGFLGFMLGVMAVMATSKPYAIINFVVPILIIAVPVLDMGFTILRRFVRGKPLFIGDRDHVYDSLLKKGISQPKVWTIMCGMQAVLAGIGVWLVR